jgi:tetratricopeptide (TPR) repeat protein
VKRPQLILAGAGFLLLIIIYFFGETNPPQSLTPLPALATAGTTTQLSSDDVIASFKSQLTPLQLSRVNSLEHSVVRGDVKNQQITAFGRLAEFWKDSVRDGFLPYAYYLAETAKLENSEKKLTFAAQLFLDNLRGQENQGIKNWMANDARELFEKALRLDPDNDSSKIGLGACYIFGSSANSPQEVMQGIQQVLAVARRDSTNMYAQFVLGLGGEISGQFDKAIERLSKVVQHEPGNVEAILTLAEINEKQGNKKAAIKWYENAKGFIINDNLTKEINERIKLLQ